MSAYCNTVAAATHTLDTVGLWAAPHTHCVCLMRVSFITLDKMAELVDGQPGPAVCVCWVDSHVESCQRGDELPPSSLSLLTFFFPSGPVCQDAL